MLRWNWLVSSHVVLQFVYCRRWSYFDIWYEHSPPSEKKTTSQPQSLKRDIPTLVLCRTIADPKFKTNGFFLDSQHYLLRSTSSQLFHSGDGFGIFKISTTERKIKVALFGSGSSSVSPSFDLGSIAPHQKATVTNLGAITDAVFEFV